MIVILIWLAAAVAINIICFRHIGQREIAWAAERRDMLDRLMSKDIVEYKQLQPVAAAPKSEPVDMTDEEEYMREIESMKSGAG